jgi:hypothetical protein
MVNTVHHADHDLRRVPCTSPNLTLDSCSTPDAEGPRPGNDRVPVWRDVAGVLAGIPGIVVRLVRTACHAGATVCRDG